MKTLLVKKQHTSKKGSALLGRVKEWLKNEASDENANKVVWTYIGIGIAMLILTIMAAAAIAGTTNVADFFTGVTEGENNQPSGWKK